MRYALCLALLPLPAAAWEFRPDPVCTLFHQSDRAEVTITHDPGAAMPYAIEIRLSTGRWPDAPTFGLTYEGRAPLAIGTHLHALSEDGMTLRVEDRGFGNVLDGLEFNDSVTAVSGAMELRLSLADAAPEVRAFRACPAAALS